MIFNSLGRAFELGIIGVDFLLDRDSAISLMVITRTGGGYFDVYPRLIIRVFKLFLA